MRITSEAGAQDTACETARENLLADKTARDPLIGVYAGQTEEPTTGEPSAERNGEAREKWSPFAPLVCSIFGLVMGSVLHEAGCEAGGANAPGGRYCHRVVNGAFDVPVMVGCWILF